MPDLTYYDLLEVDSFASPDEIRAAYRRLAKEYHPDTIPEEMRSRRIGHEAAETFRLVTEAYEVLIDPVKRKSYDEALQGLEQPSSPHQPPPSPPPPSPPPSSATASASPPPSPPSWPDGQSTRFALLALAAMLALVAATVIYRAHPSPSHPPALQVRPAALPTVMIPEPYVGTIVSSSECDLAEDDRRSCKVLTIRLRSGGFIKEEVDGEIEIYNKDGAIIYPVNYDSMADYGHKFVTAISKLKSGVKVGVDIACGRDFGCIIDTIHLHDQLTAQSQQGEEEFAITDKYADPFAYCKAVVNRDNSSEGGPDDNTRYIGRAFPNAVIAAIKTSLHIAIHSNTIYPQFAWRCMDGKVYICYFGGTGRSCRMADTSERQSLAIKRFCAENPNASVPNSVNNSASEWRCDGYLPVEEIFYPVDKRGYLEDNWVYVPAPSLVSSPSSPLLNRLEAESRAQIDPMSYPGLSQSIAANLSARECKIPQAYFQSELHNAISGEFTRPGQKDWAVMCMRGGEFTVLLYRNGISTDPTTIYGPWSDELRIDDFEKNGGTRIGYNRRIFAVGKEYIMRHYQAYGGPKPPPIDHQGIDIYCCRQASETLYWYDNEWYKLQGAD